MNQQRESEATRVPAIALPAQRESIDSTTLNLLGSWRISDATDSQDQILAAEQELAEFKSAMNRTRIAANDPVLYP